MSAREREEEMGEKTMRRGEMCGPEKVFVRVTFRAELISVLFIRVVSVEMIAGLRLHAERWAAWSSLGHVTRVVQSL